MFPVRDLFHDISQFCLFVDETTHEVFASADQLLILELTEIEEVKGFNRLTGPYFHALYNKIMKVQAVSHKDHTQLASTITLN